MLKLKALKGIMKAAKPAVELVELAGAVAVVGGATREYAPRAWSFILATVGVKPRVAGAIDMPDDDKDDCALATSEVVVQEVDDCGCKNGGSPAPAPSTPSTPGAPPKPPTRKPCSVSKASTPPPASDSPTGKWVWINGSWLPGAGYACKNGDWVLAPVIVPRTPAVPSTAPVPLAPLRGADGASAIDVCPACATGPITASGTIRLVPCEIHDAVARANSAHVESLTLGWAQSWELGDAAAMPKIDDPKYTGLWGRFKSDAYIADMRAYHASLTPGGTVPAAVKPGLLQKVAIYALDRQARRFSDEAVATRELLANSSGGEQIALQTQLDQIDRSRNHADALLAKLKNPAPGEDADVQNLATDIVAASKMKGGLDQLFANIATAQPSGGPVVAPPLNPGVVPPSIPVSGAIDYPDVDGDCGCEDIAAALGLPPVTSMEDLDLLYGVQQSDGFTDEDLVALGATMADIEVGCATGACGLAAE